MALETFLKLSTEHLYDSDVDLLREDAGELYPDYFCDGIIVYTETFHTDGPERGRIIRKLRSVGYSEIFISLMMQAVQLDASLVLFDEWLDINPDFPARGHGMHETQFPEDRPAMGSNEPNPLYGRYLACDHYIRILPDPIPDLFFGEVYAQEHIRWVVDLTSRKIVVLQSYSGATREWKDADPSRYAELEGCMEWCNTVFDVDLWHDNFAQYDRIPCFDEQEDEVEEAA